MNPVKNYEAENAIGAYLIAKFGTSAGQADVASANTDGLIGVNGSIAQSAGERIDITHFGFAEVKLGGNVTKGDFVTADSAGKGVKLTDTMLESGAINSVGIAMATGVTNDIIPLFVLLQKVSKFDAVTASAAELNILDGATVTVAEVNILDGVTADKDELNLLDDQMGTPGIDVSAEDTNVVTVTIQLKKANGDDLAARGCLKAYLSDDANGDSVVATAPDGHVAISGDGLCMHLITDKVFLLTSESDGDITLTVTESGTKSCYLILVLPSGKLVASAEIAHAA
jgi:hypothetical protein